MGTRTAVAVWLAAIAGANLLAATYGPSITVATAFVLIGLDLSLRDHLHDAWDTGRRFGGPLVVKMLALIGAGGAISYAINADAGPIAVASMVAFSAAAAVDGAIYAAARYWPTLARMNTSNVAGAAVDSLLFPTLAFGGILWGVTAGQFAAKVAGGLVWSVVIVTLRRRTAVA